LVGLVVSMTAEQIARRLAEADVGEVGWPMMPEQVRSSWVRHWLDVLVTIDDAGLALVEKKDGR